MIKKYCMSEKSLIKSKGYPLTIPMHKEIIKYETKIKIYLNKNRTNLPLFIKNTSHIETKKIVDNSTILIKVKFLEVAIVRKIKGKPVK